jgi:hypothetical protein
VLQAQRDLKVHKEIQELQAQLVQQVQQALMVKMAQ